MKPITCIAIDDEPMALLIIEQFCLRKGNISLTTFCEPSTGLHAIEKTEPELVFLDIQMNSIDGLEIASRLPSKCCFIFTTAHAQYALEGFNLDAVDFLHKPFSYERFEKAVNKALRRIESSSPPPVENLVVKQEYCNVSIPVNDITYIEALGNYIKIFRLSGGYILSHTNMKNILCELPKNKFIRIHRSFIISIDKVKYFTKNKVKIEGNNSCVPIGKRYSEEAYKKLYASKPDYLLDCLGAG